MENSMENEKIALNDSEWKIMNILWEKHPLTITQLTGLLEETTGWDKHTVIVLLKRMEAKKIVVFDQGTKAKLYRPILAKEDAMLYESENFLNKVFKGQIGLMISTMLDNEALTEEEINSLYTLIVNHQGTGKK